MTAPARFIDGTPIPIPYWAKVEAVISEICDIEDEFPAWELEEFSRRARADQGEHQ